MWKGFQCNDVPYIIRAVSKENEMEICLSDMRSIWCEKVSFEVILERFREHNQLLEITDIGVKDQVNAAFDQIEKAQDIEIERGSHLSLRIRSRLDRFILEFHFYLMQDSNRFFSEVVSNLVQTVIFLEDKQKIMSDLLMKRERQLVDYTLEKGALSGEDLLTNPFKGVADDKVVSNQLMLNIYSKNIFRTKFSGNFGNLEPFINELEADEDRKPVKRKVYRSTEAPKKRRDSGE